MDPFTHDTVYSLTDSITSMQENGTDLLTLH
jgi:hypothetical protein